jgi:hypothetical protein
VQTVTRLKQSDSTTPSGIGKSLKCEANKQRILGKSYDPDFIASASAIRRWAKVRHWPFDTCCPVEEARHRIGG